MKHDSITYEFKNNEFFSQSVSLKQTQIYNTVYHLSLGMKCKYRFHVATMLFYIPQKYGLSRCCLFNNYIKKFQKEGYFVGKNPGNLSDNTLVDIVQTMFSDYTTVEQHNVLIFMVREGKIHRRMLAQYGENYYAKKVHQWMESFQRGRTSTVGGDCLGCPITSQTTDNVE